MEKVTQTASYWGTGIALLGRNHTRTLLDHMDCADGITGVKCSLTFVKKLADCHQHMVQETREKTVQMEGTWRLESTSAGLHPCETSIQKQCEGCVDTAWGRH